MKIKWCEYLFYMSNYPCFACGKKDLRDCYGILYIFIIIPKKIKSLIKNIKFKASTWLYLKSKKNKDDIPF